MKEAFKENNPESVISLKIKLKTKEKPDYNSKIKYNFRAEVVGKAIEIDSLILRMRKTVKFIIKATKNLKNED